jgi:hypothetical protein
MKAIKKFAFHNPGSSRSDHPTIAVSGDAIAIELRNANSFPLTASLTVSIFPADIARSKSVNFSLGPSEHTLIQFVIDEDPSSLFDWSVDWAFAATGDFDDDPLVNITIHRKKPAKRPAPAPLPPAPTPPPNDQGDGPAAFETFHTS